MQIRERFMTFVRKAKRSLGRFPVAFANTALFFVLTLVSIWSGEMNHNIERLLVVCVCSAVLATAVSLGFECLTDKYESARPIAAALSVLAEFVLFVLCQFLDERVLLRAAFGLVAAGFIMSFCFVSKKGKAMSYTAKALKNAAFSCFAGFVVFVGGFICILAFDFLVYSDFRFTDKLLFTHMLMCCVLVSSLVLVLLPSADETRENPGKGYKAVTVYAGLSLYLVLSAILYIYIIKMLISFELPSGGVNPFVTMASMAYIFFIFAVSGYEEENAYVRFFSKFGGYLMIPLVVVQCIALGIRISYYGLTSARVISVCLIAVTVMFVAGSVFRKKIGFGIPCITAAAIVLLVTITPLNYQNLALWNQEYIMTSTLEKTGMLKDGKLNLDAEISEDDRSRISGAYIYLVENGNLPEYLTENYPDNYAFADKFGYGYVQRPHSVSYCYYDNAEFASELTDISGYGKIALVHEGKAKSCLPGEGIILKYTDPDGITHGYDLEPFARYLLEKYENGQKYGDKEGIYPLDGQTDIYYRYMSFEYNSSDGEITNFDMSAYLLFK